jgi:hypothetical protein
MKYEGEAGGDTLIDRLRGQAEAADEIERFSAENERLTTKLEAMERGYFREMKRAHEAESGLAALLALRKESDELRSIDIVFDGPPSHESGRFVEVERGAASIKIGEWVHRPDGYWVLRIPDPEALASQLVKVNLLRDTEFQRAEAYKLRNKVLDTRIAELVDEIKQREAEVEK